jgi:hypothetical protein
MAQTGRGQPGMEHWRRAVRWTFFGIFVAAVAGGLLGSATRGSLADAASEAQQHATTSSSHDSTGAPASASASASAAVSATKKSPPVSPKIAAQGTAALLQLSALPSGWTSGGTPAAPTRVSPWSSKLASCVGIPAKVASVAPTKVNSPDYTSADQIDAVEDSVSVYPSAAKAQAEYTALASSKTTTCMNRVASTALQQNMQKEAGTTTTVGVVSFSALPAGAAALHLTGFTVTIPIARGGRVLTVTSTQVDFVSGALLHQVTFNGNGAAFPAPLEEQLLSTMQAAH